MSLPRGKKVWVNWKREKLPDGKITKVPYQPNGYKANSVDSATWRTYNEVKEVQHLFDGIGVVFTGSMLGIDLDKCLLDGKIVDKASEKIVEESNTLTEISPSGTGIHLYFNLSEPVELEKHKHTLPSGVAYECYTEGRYFTVTETPFGENKEVRTIDAVEATRLLAILGYPWNTHEKTAPQVHTSLLSESEVLRIMFRAKNGVRARALYDGDTTAYKGDESAADSALCCLLAFYTGKDAALIEKIWLASPLGKREKTQKRKDYRERTIENAIRYTTEVFTPDRSFDKARQFITKKTKDGSEIIVLCTQNIQIFIDSYKEFAGRFRYDTFKRHIEYRSTDTWERLTDSHVIAIQCRISELHPAFWNVSKQMVHDAIIHNAHIHSYDSVVEFFSSLVWDKTPRLDSWIQHVYGVEDTAYHRAVGSNWMKGLAFRAIHPGCKFDYVLVIEGEQGLKKTMSLEVLGGEWHTSTFLTPDNKDFFMAFAGRLIVEFSEGETHSRSDVKKLKAVITQLYDDFRPPYGREIERHPRRCVFAMTTNEAEYLKDETGNRRWLPIAATKVDIEWLKENRTQLLAEGYHRAVVLKEPYWEFPKEETEAEQRKRQFADPESEKVQEWYISLPQELRLEGVTTNDAFLALHPNSNTSFAEKTITRLDSIRIGTIFLHELLLIKKEANRSGVRSRRYFPTDKTPLPAQNTLSPDFIKDGSF